MNPDMYFRYSKSTEAAIERTVPIRMRQAMAWPRIYYHGAGPARTWTLETLRAEGGKFLHYMLK